MCYIKQIPFEYAASTIEKLDELRNGKLNFDPKWTPAKFSYTKNNEGSIKIDVRLEEETVWLTQAQLCELFQKSKATINEHIKNVFDEGELNENSVVRNFRTTASDSKSYVVNYYDLDVIISVGNRVKSQQGTQPNEESSAKLIPHLWRYAVFK